MNIELVVALVSILLGGGGIFGWIASAWKSRTDSTLAAQQVLGGTINILRDEVDALNKRIDEREEAYRALYKQYDVLAAKHLEIERQHAQLQKAYSMNCEEMTRRIATLENQLKVAGDRIQHLEKENDRLRAMHLNFE